MVTVFCRLINVGIGMLLVETSARGLQLLMYQAVICKWAKNIHNRTNQKNNKN